MVTLTYRDDVPWQAHHISKFMDAVTKYGKRRWGVVLPYVWVSEMMENGKVHYHVLIWIPRGKGKKIPKPDDSGWWPHGSSNIGKSSVPIGYLVKYASKLKSKNDRRSFPRGARLHGGGGLSAFNRAKLAWRMLPSYVRDVLGLEKGSDGKLKLPVRVRGGGFAPRSAARLVEVEGWSRKKGCYVLRKVWECVQESARVISPWEFLEIRDGCVILRERVC